MKRSSYSPGLLGDIRADLRIVKKANYMECNMKLKFCLF